MGGGGMTFTSGEVTIMCGLAAAWGTLMWRVGVIEKEQRQLRRFGHWVRNWIITAEPNISRNGHPIHFPREKDVD